MLGHHRAAAEITGLANLAIDSATPGLTANSDVGAGIEIGSKVVDGSLIVSMADKHVLIYNVALLSIDLTRVIFGEPV
jgi:hypothetical protein